jgi:hypothetical protein
MDQRGWERHDPQAMKNLIESFQGYRTSFAWMASRSGKMLHYSYG